MLLFSRRVVGEIFSCMKFFRCKKAFRSSRTRFRMQSWTFLLLTKLCKSYEIAKPKCVCQQFRCDFVVRCHYYYKLRTSLWNDYPNILKTFERHTSMTHFPFFSLETKLRSNCQIENFFGENIKAENWELTKKKGNVGSK